MIYRDLYQKILIDPASMGNDELFIVSGYASATFLRRHLEDIKEISSNIIINLLIGMPHKKNDHRAYLNIKDSYPNSFNGFYYIGTPEFIQRHMYGQKIIPLGLVSLVLQITLNMVFFITCKKIK